MVAAFTNGLRKGKFLFSLNKNDLKTMSEVLYRTTKYMNAEDALSAREEKPRKRERPEDARQDHGRKKLRTRDRREEKHSKPPGGRFTSFTPLNAPLNPVLMQIMDEGSLTFPGKLKSDPTKRSRNKYCRFHRDHGHDTADCYDLKQQIETLIREGKLQKFVSKERTNAHTRGTGPSTGERPSETPCRGHKDDSRGHSSNGIVQKGPKDLPQDGPECTVNGFCT